jgi:predicted esterase
VSAPVVRTIETVTHGRYLTLIPSRRPTGLLVGFHGYAEDADTHLAALAAIPGVERWLVVAVQALHPFYRRDQRIVASWMTSQDRDLAIADNLAYVRRVVETVMTEHGVERPIVFAGFSQGGAMAYRAAADQAGDGLIILAADVPPDVAAAPNVRLPRVLLGRGTTDSWYTAEKHEADLGTLRGVGVDVQSLVFDGGHEWTPPFRDAASRYLAALAGPG